MKLKQHLDVGKYILDNLDSKYEINKQAYLFGNIAPDLNCVYPAHRLKTTENRFYKRLQIVDNTSFNTIKSFTLGVITHYICDYFCYAHNIESIGIVHKKYETNLYNYYESHLNEILEDREQLKDVWKYNKLKSKNQIIKNNTIDVESHCKLILEQIKNMNTEYLKHIYKSEDNSWAYKNQQMKVDLEYAMFMVENITALILEPFKCLTVQH